MRMNDDVLYQIVCKQASNHSINAVKNAVGRVYLFVIHALPIFTYLFMVFIVISIPLAFAGFRFASMLGNQVNNCMKEPTTRQREKFVNNQVVIKKVAIKVSCFNIMHMFLAPVIASQQLQTHDPSCHQAD